MKIDENNENEPNENGTANKLLLKCLSVICCAGAFLLAKSCTRTIISDFNLGKFSQNNYKAAKDAGFVKGFEIVNTSALEDYCSDSGYIPNIFINKFKKRFEKTILNANNTLEQYGTKEQIKTEVIDKVYQSSIDTLNNDFNKLHAKYGISKTQYCQLFDNEADDILTEKAQLLIQQRPDTYKD